MPGLSNPRSMNQRRSQRELRLWKAMLAVAQGINPYSMNTPLDLLRFVNQLSELIARRTGEDPEAVSNRINNTKLIDSIHATVLNEGLPFVAGDWEKQLRGIARTETTLNFNDQVLQQLAQEGYTSKEWVAHRDVRTRQSHSMTNGTIIPLADPFIMSGWPMMYPGDANGPAEEVIQCRCVLTGHRGPDDVTTQDWFTRETQGNTSAELEEFLSSMSADVNSFLRGETVANRDEVVSIINKMDKEFITNGKVLDQDRLFSRGIKLSSSSPIEPGTVITDQAYVSISAKQEPGSRYSQGGAEVDVVVPSGHKVLQGNGSEYEALLPRGSSFTVEQHDPDTGYLKLRVR